MAMKKKSTTEVVRDDEVAEVLTWTDYRAAATIKEWCGGLSEINALTATLAMKIDDLHNGNMNRTEAMLLMQAHTLNELFNNLALRAYSQEGLAQFETFLRIALKSTGARTSEGKAVLAQNAYKSGLRSIMREISALLREQKKSMKLIK